MIGWLTPYARRKLLDNFHRVAAWQPPATVYLGFTEVLLTQSASVLPAGSECTGPGYARTAFTWDPTLWSAADASGASIPLRDLDTFTATGVWTVPGRSFFWADAAVAGNLLVAGSIDGDKLILPATGELVHFPASSYNSVLAVDG